MPDVADPPPARIDYAPRPRLRRRLTRALKLTLLAAVSVAALYYAQPLWQRVMISRYVSKSAKDSVRPGEAVVLLNPSTAPVNLPQVLTDSYGFPYPKVYGRQHAPWLALRSELGLKPPGFLLPVFVNERTARDGTRWIVAVEFDGYSQFLFTLVECTPLW